MGRLRLRDLARWAITSELPTTREVSWPSIVGEMAICPQALPAQLEYPHD